ncbi:hypothetical protein [Micromonospora craniellae]|uniref:hypothetical protein n=1 Tax=Micromonospora craniellae TaxID=2294034 RepID=UPI00168AE57E|nr:hypothetical protein [Micromonospora craniellae]QOC91944.1 hypothetical protein ID554_29365 [Micromonospora craniellae]
MNAPAQPSYPPRAGWAPGVAAPVPQPGAAPDGMVLVAVPLAYVPHVARLLAELDAGQRSSPPRARVEPTPGPPAADWTVEDLRRLSQGRSATHRTVAAVLDALAAAPDRMFTVQDLAQATGRPRKKIVGAMAGLTRLLKAHYDYAGRGLPFARVDGRPEAPRELCYTVDARRAACWREARSPRTPETTAPEGRLPSTVAQPADLVG